MDQAKVQARQSDGQSVAMLITLAPRNALLHLDVVGHIAQDEWVGDSRCLSAGTGTSSAIRYPLNGVEVLRVIAIRSMEVGKCSRTRCHNDQNRN